MKAYRVLLSHPSVRWLVAAALTSRLVTPVLSLSLLLAVRAGYGSYALGGAVLAGYAFALAFAVPVAGRLVDRVRPRPVLLGCLAVHVAAYAVLLTALALRAPGPVLVGCAVLLGASTPPAGSVIRGTWSAVVPSEQVHTAYALDAVTNEAALIGGPLLVAVLVTVVPAVLVVLVAGVGITAGVLILSQTPAVKGRSGVTPGRAGSRVLGPLSDSGVRRLLAVVAFDSFSYGSLIVAITATATARHHPSAAGLLIAVMSVGVVVSGLVYGARRRRADASRQLAVLYAAGGVLMVGAGYASDLPVLGAALLAAGMVGGPRDTLVQLVLGEAAPPEQRTEAFAWMTTVMWSCYGLGTSAAGRFIGAGTGPARATFLLAAAAALLAAVVSVRVRTGRVPSAAATRPAGGT